MSVSGNQFRGAILPVLSAVTPVAVTTTLGSTWYQAIASTSSPIYVTSIVFGAQSNTATFDAYLGTGAAASEIIVVQLGVFQVGGATYGSDHIHTLPFPIRIPSGTRVAVRSSVANGYMVIHYVPESAVI